MRALRSWLPGVMVLVGTTVAAAILAVVLLAFCAVRLARRRTVGRKMESQGTARGAAASGQKRVHIVLSRREEGAETPFVPEAKVPRVEHEGEWHTLH